MKKETVTYSEAFKMQVVEEISSGKFATITQAQKAYGIRGMTTIQKWIKKYGKGRFAAETGKGGDDGGTGRIKRSEGAYTGSGKGAG
jgi:transposase-like protein